MKCTAHRTNGEPCKNNAVTGKQVCRKHGGATPSGIASPHFKTGKYSKYLPEGMLTAYQDARADEMLLSVRHDIHLLDALILSKLGNLDTGESAAHWDFLLKQITLARKSYNNDDYGAFLQAMDEMEALADKRRLHYATEQEITSQLEQRRKMVETEQKINIQAERVITSEQAMLLVSAMLDSVKRNVTDVSALTRIQADFIQFIGGGNQQRVIVDN